MTSRFLDIWDRKEGTSKTGLDEKFPTLKVSPLFFSGAVLKIISCPFALHLLIRDSIPPPSGEGSLAQLPPNPHLFMSGATLQLFVIFLTYSPPIVNDNFHLLPV